MGRPTDCTPELTAILAAAMRTGMSVRGACALARIHHDTYYDWLKRGDTGEEPYRGFSDTISYARAEGERKLVRLLRVGKIKAAGPIFLLKASYQYRDNDPVQPAAAPESGPTPGTPEHTEAVMQYVASIAAQDPEFLARVQARLKERK